MIYINMKKILQTRDIVFMTIAAILGIRWLPIAASYGAAAIVLWVLAALLFLVPLGLVATELATTWPEEGGLYIWVKQAYGDKWGFMASWFYWVNNFFFYPALLAFIAVTAVFLINPALANNKLVICSIIIACLWFVTLLNLRSMQVMKWVADLGGLFGVILPGIVLVALAMVVVFIWHQPIPTDYSWSHWWPHLGKGSNIVFLSTLMFAMAGMEITPTLAGEVKNPQKTFPRALFISALLIVGLYITGTVAITWLITPDKIDAASGIMEALAVITSDLHLPWLLMAVTIMIIIGSLGAMSMWVVTPLKMLLESTKMGVLPHSLTKLNKHDMPSRAMLVQAVVITGIILITALMPSVNALYETLVLMATITYFIPYVFMFSAFFRLRAKYPHKHRPYHIPGGKWLAWLVGMLGFLSVLLAIVLPFITAPADLKTINAILLYKIEIAAGPILFFLIGYLIYTIYEQKKS